eukprot:PhM_4_TR3082/c0_g1_i1/m.53987
MGGHANSSFTCVWAAELPSFVEPTKPRLNSASPSSTLAQKPSVERAVYVSGIESCTVDWLVAGLTMRTRRNDADSPFTSLPRTSAMNTLTLKACRFVELRNCVPFTATEKVELGSRQLAEHEAGASLANAPVLMRMLLSAWNRTLPSALPWNLASGAVSTASMYSPSRAVVKVMSNSAVPLSRSWAFEPFVKDRGNEPVGRGETVQATGAALPASVARRATLGCGTVIISGSRPSTASTATVLRARPMTQYLGSICSGRKRSLLAAITVSSTPDTALMLPSVARPDEGIARTRKPPRPRFTDELVKYSVNETVPATALAVCSFAGFQCIMDVVVRFVLYTLIAVIFLAVRSAVMRSTVSSVASSPLSPRQ